MSMNWIWCQQTFLNLSLHYLLVAVFLKKGLIAFHFSKKVLSFSKCCSFSKCAFVFKMKSFKNWMTFVPKISENFGFFDSYFWPFDKSEEKIKVIFVMPSIWNVFIKFHWHDEKLTFGTCIYNINCTKNGGKNTSCGL